MFFEPLRLEVGEDEAGEQWTYAHMSAERMELIEAAEQESESEATPSARSCFSMCSSEIGKQKFVAMRTH